MPRIIFQPLSEKDFSLLFSQENYGSIKNLVGGRNLDIFQTKKPYLRGSGLLDILGSLGKLALPIIKKYILPSALNFASEVGHDIIDGRNVKSALKHRGLSNLKSVVEK